MSHLSRPRTFALGSTFVLAAVLWTVSAFAAGEPAKRPAKTVPPMRPSPCAFGTVSQFWDFATGPQGFYLVACDIEGGAQVWQHGDTDIPGAPVQVWGTVLTGDYPNNTGSGLASPYFTVTPSSYLVQVNHYFATEYEYDGCNVEVYPDFTVIAPIEGYTVSAISPSGSYYAYCVDGEPGWTGSSGGWRSDCFDLSAYMGRTIALFFDFGSDASVTAAGWYLASVALGAPSPMGACCNAMTGACQVLTQVQCQETGGVWHPEWATCEPNPCPQPGFPCTMAMVSLDWDFSTGSHGFELRACDSGGAPVWEYGHPAGVPNAPPNVWGTVLSGAYPNDAGAELGSPSFVVTQSTRTVEVIHYFDTEYGYDGCNLSLYPYGTVVTPIAGYTIPVISESPSYYAWCVDGEPGWTGQSGAWRIDCFDLSSFMGSTVSLSFDFGSDASATSMGWYLARVRVGGDSSIVNGGVTMGAWSGAEPWHDWIPAMPGSTVPIELHPGELTGQIQSVDFYISTTHGESWQFVGSDTDGSEPRLNTTDTSVQPEGDGWCVVAPVPELPPDWPLQFKAVAHLNAGGERAAIGVTSTDPAPPSLGTTSVHDWVVTDRDTMGVEIDPNGTEVSEIVIFRGSKTDEFTKGIPGIDQHFLGNDYCAPTAAGECLKYFETQGDYQVTGGYDNLQLCTFLADYMYTTPGIGTYASDWSEGLASWIRAHGDGYTVRLVKHYTARGAWTWTPADWRFMRNELERCQDVLLGVFWSTGGAHALTLNSIRNSALPDGRIRLGFMDPWTGQASSGDLDTSTGVLHGVTGAGGGHNAYIGVTMVVSPRELEINLGGPGTAIYDGLPAGGPPYHVTVELPMEGAWFLHVVLVNNLGHAYRSSYVVVRENPAGTPDRTEGVPLAFALQPGAPNPFRYRTDLAYAVPTPSSVMIAVYDAGGRKVRTLVDSREEPGFHVVSWDGTDGRARPVAPGTYFVKMKAEGWRATRTITLLK